MEKRIISIDISPDIQNDYSEKAGVMWEHNATQLQFKIDPSYIGDYRYYIEYCSLLGTKVRTEYLEIDTETKTVAYDIPVTMSSLKGVECYFNIVRIDDDGNTVQVIKPKKFCLTFDFSPDTDNSLAKVNDFSINTLLEAIRLGTFKGEKGDRGDKGEKGDKGDKGDNGVITDDAMSNKSGNPVQNKVVKEYIDYKNNLNFLDDETKQISFKEQDDKLIAVTSGTLGGITLDTIAYDGKTYRDIFVTNNITPWGDFESGIEGVIVNAGSPEVVSDVYNSGSHSLKVAGTTSQQLSYRVTVNTTTLYSACYGRVDRYVQGGLGVQISPGAGTTVSGNLTETTNDFTRVSAITTTTADNRAVDFYCGSMNSANLEGYLDDVVFIDLSIFSAVPSKETMDTLYENYINIITSQGLGTGESTNTSYVIGEKQSTVNYTDEECISAFMEKVNEKAQELGMTNSSFGTPSGVEETEKGNLSTAKDLVKLYVSATSYNELMRIWGKDERVIATKNEPSKSVTIATTVKSDLLEDYYYIFGGKTGTWETTDGTIYNLGVIGKVLDKVVVGVIMNANGSNSRFIAMKSLFDIAKQVIENPNTDTSSLSVGNSQSACCCILPEYNTAMYEQYPFEYLFEQEADTQILPASVTKVITAMTMLDYVTDLEETITFIQEDYDIGGSGRVFSAGDIITYRDSLYALMLSSSNMTAQAIARSVGRKILEKAKKNL